MAVISTKNGEKVVPFIGLKKDKKSALDRGVVKLHNYRPTYHRPVRIDCIVLFTIHTLHWG